MLILFIRKLCSLYNFYMYKVLINCCKISVKYVIIIKCNLNKYVRKDIGKYFEKNKDSGR